MRRLFRIIVLFLGLILAFIPSGLQADGALFRVGVPSEVSIPSQQAVILFDGSEEKLILKIQFEGEGEDFAWVIPVPALPHVEIAPPILFPILETATRPEIITTHSDIFFYGPFLLLFISLCLPAVIVGKRIGCAVVIAFFVSFFVSVIVLNLFTMRSRGRGIGPAAPVTVHETRTVGPYDIAVLSSADPQALLAWLDDKNYPLPQDAVRIVDEYVRKGWNFIACRLSPSKAEGVARQETPPLVMGFPASEPVYPMRLTSLSAGKSDILIYVLADNSYSARGFITEDARAIKESQRSTLEERLQIDVKQYANLRLTRLYGSFSSSQMEEDVVLVRSGTNRERRSHAYTDKAKRLVLWMTAAAVALMLLYLTPRIALPRSLPFAIIALGVLIALRPWVLIAPSSYKYKEIRAGHPSIKGNMHTLQLALEDFSEITGGFFPSDFGVTVKEVLEQQGIRSDIDKSIAGAPGLATVFVDEIGRHGATFLPKSYSHPLYPTQWEFPALVLSKEDPPEWAGPYVTYYVPLDVEGKMAKGYKVHGSDGDSLLKLVLSSEDD